MSEQACFGLIGPDGKYQEASEIRTKMNVRNDPKSHKNDEYDKYKEYGESSEYNENNAWQIRQIWQN